MFRKSFRYLEQHHTVPRKVWPKVSQSLSYFTIMLYVQYLKCCSKITPYDETKNMSVAKGEAGYLFALLALEQAVKDRLN